MGPARVPDSVIHTIISQIASGLREIKLGALSPTRDFNFVADTCAVFLDVGNSDTSLGQLINAVSNFEISIGATAALIAEVMNVELTICCNRFGFPPIHLAGDQP